VLIPRLTATAMTGTNNPAYSAAWPSKAAMTFSTAWLREKPAPLPTERVAIAKAIEEEIGNRQGKRTDLELRIPVSEVQSKRTRDIAAEKSGFGSEVTYRRAKAIEEEIGNRQGKRTDLELRVERPEVKDKRPREVAAGKAGFGSEVAVVENHTPKSGMTFAVELNGVL
jgi:DNA primase large subunit